MRVLKLGSFGARVKHWQHFLLGQGFSPGAADADFGPRTEAATKAFQRRHGLRADGIVGNATLGQAMLLGFQIVDTEDDSRHGPNWPPPPDFDPLVGTRARQEVFGRFRYAHSPTSANPERIRILEGWQEENIVTVTLPQLVGIPGYHREGRVRFHRLAAGQLQDLWSAWASAGLTDRIQSFDGAFTPRFIRGSRTTLSNHAFGTAFDINASTNPLGARPPLFGDEGCVRELVELAHEHGFFWGGHFRRRPDGMHFEIAKVLEAVPA